MSLVIVGSIALDSIATPAGKVEEALGGSAVYASLAARNFCETHIVGVIGEDFPTHTLDMLESHGIGLSGVERKVGQTFRWKGEYLEWNKANTLETHLNVFADFDPRLPDTCKACDYLLLGNIHPNLQASVLEQIGSRKLTACDTMNYWINRNYIELLEVIRKVDIVFINEEELRLLTTLQNIYTAARTVLDLGPKLIVVKRGEYGSVAVGKDFLFFAPVYPVTEIVDPTGAGDSFAGGFMGYLTETGKFDHQTIREAMIYGTIMAGYNVTAFSTQKLEKVHRIEINAKKIELHKWVSF